MNVATHFDQALNITGSILTKLDGDARGGAALSLKSVTGKPIKFAGVGGWRTAPYDTDWNNFGPRGGVAYSILHRTVLRGGYTMSYDMVAGRYKLPWEASVQVTDGTSCGFATPTRGYQGAEQPIKKVA